MSMAMIALIPASPHIFVSVYIKKIIKCSRGIDESGMAGLEIEYFLLMIDD